MTWIHFASGYKTIFFSSELYNNSELPVCGILKSACSHSQITCPLDKQWRGNFKRKVGSELRGKQWVRAVGPLRSLRLNLLHVASKHRSLNFLQVKESVLLDGLRCPSSCHQLTLPFTLPPTSISSNYFHFLPWLLSGLCNNYKEMAIQF